MSTEFQDLWRFGEFRLDVRRKILWHGEQSVPMPLKGLEVLSILVRNRGELVTKDELVSEIWEDSFVEESNLSRHIYLLRKTLKDFGAEDGLIENVPRRGYRFTGEASEIEVGDIVVEKHTRTRTSIEFQEDSRPVSKRIGLLAYASFAVILASASVFFAFQYFRGQALAPAIKSIAVLPFKTLGADDTAPHIGTGLADILTTRLGNIRDLKVRPVSAATSFAGQDAVSAGERLQVDAVLEGTIYYQKDRVRVTARLVRTRDSFIVWSGEFEKLKRDELRLQNDLAAQIVPLLATNLSGAERDALAKIYTESPDAYDLYVRGRYEWNKRSTPGMSEAQRLFRNAIEADPTFALAYVGLADTLNMHQPSASEAQFLIARALELDPNLAEAYAARGFYSMFHQWDWPAAEADLKRAVELNPNFPTAHQWYATLLAIKGETEAAKAEMRRALELNPISPNFLADLGQLYYFSGDYATAEQYCLKALELDPDFTFGHEYLHYIYLQTGEYEKAVNEIEKADAINAALVSDSSVPPDSTGKYQEVYRESGIKGYLDYRYPGTPNDPSAFYLYAIRHAFSGENDKALVYLEKATDSRMFLSAFVKANPAFEHLRSEPRYQKILRKMRLA